MRSPPVICASCELRLVVVKAPHRLQEQVRGNGVCAKAEEGDRQHEPGGDVGRFGEATPGLEQDEPRDTPQEHRVDDRRKDREAELTERPAAVCGPASEHDGEEGETDAGDVGEQVPGVR
jgi:hypothetical protein